MAGMRGCSAIGATLLILGCAAASAMEDADQLDAVVVRANRSGASATATLSASSIFELPMSATTLESTSFADRLPKDVADLADYSAGVARRSNYWGVNTPTFQLRGFNAGDATAYYKDGFRYQGRGPLSMANVESIEILRGPQSAIYGWSEPGGVVQIRVQQPSAQTVRSASVQTDTWGRTIASIDAGGPLTDGNRFRLVAAHEKAGSFRDRQHGNQTLLAPSFAWDIAGARQLSVSLEWLDDRRSTDYGIPAVNGAPAEVPVSRVYTEDWGQQHSQSTRLAVRWMQPAWGGDLAVAWSYYTFKYLVYHDVEPYSVAGTTVKRWYESYPERYRWVTGYIDWSREFLVSDISHRIATRLELARESRSLYGGVLDEFPAIDAFNPLYGQPWAPTVDYSVYDQAWTNRSLGFAVQDEIRTGNWTWLLGLRYGYLRQVFDYADYLPTPGQDHSIQIDRSVTPRLGVTWHAAPSLALYANYSAGNMATLPQSRAFGGGTFAPLTSVQVEAGVKLQPASGNWLASAALFDIERRNVLTRDPDHPGFSVQTGVQRSRGIELEWQGRVAPRWRLTAQGTWLEALVAADNRYAPGNRLPYAPRFGAASWLTYVVETGGAGNWTLSGGVVHQGERYADFANGTRLPGYTRFDLGASYREQAWSATLALENATDMRYYSSGVENRPAVIYPGSPRTVSLKLAHKFR